MRAHYRNPLQDTAGNIQPGSVVGLYQPGTPTLLGVPVWADGASATQLPNPFTSPDGTINFYLDAPQRIDLWVTAPGQSQVIFADIDVELSDFTAGDLTFPGTGASSTAVGAGSSAAGVQGVALGDSAAAAGGPSLACGQGAVASAPGATAVGPAAVASGSQGTAAGTSAAAGVSGTAVGSGASAASSPSGGTALGANTSASGISSTAAGVNASSTGAHSTALGADAAVSADHQVMIGSPEDAAVFPGGMINSFPADAATAVTGSGTIPVSADAAALRVTTAGNVTGVILAPGVYSGQMITVINISANTITFAASGASNVADGTGDVIGAFKAPCFIWDVTTALWYKMA